MKPVNTMIAAAIGLMALSACNKNTEFVPTATGEEKAVQTGQASSSPSETAKSRCGKGGDVYTLSNDANDNKVFVYSQGANGMLTYKASYSTGGKGTGAGLGSQGALTLDNDNKVLLAVNAGSNTVSAFKVNNNNLKLMSVVSSGGTMPVSVDTYGDLVYVLNAGGTANISGFKMQANSGKLNPITNSTRPLSTINPQPAQVAFAREGKVLIVTEKMTNTITSYTVTGNGTPGAMHTLASTTPTPFGFEVGNHGNILVSHAAGGAPGASTLSSYQVANNGVISVVQGPVATGQTATCWVVLSANGLYAYSTNTGSNNLSSFNTNVNNGGLNLKMGVAAPAGTAPIDAAVSMNYLYVLNSMSHSITAYSGEQSGNLMLIQTVTGLPAGAVGMAAE